MNSAAQKASMPPLRLAAALSVPDVYSALVSLALATVATWAEPKRLRCSTFNDFRLFSTVFKGFRQSSTALDGVRRSSTISNPGSPSLG